jgi:hypothetical protein
MTKTEAARVEKLYAAMVAARKAFDDYMGEDGEAEYHAWKRAASLYDRELS